MGTISKYIKIVLITGIISVMFYFIGGSQLQFSAVEQKMLESEGILPDFGENTVIEQPFQVYMDYIKEISFRPVTFGRDNTGAFELQVLNGSDEVILSVPGRAEDCIDNQLYVINLDEELKVKRGDIYSLRMIFYGEKGNNPSLYYSLKDNQWLSDWEMRVNGQLFDGSACIAVKGIKQEWFGVYYWWLIAALIFFLILYTMRSEYLSKKGKFTVATLFIAIWKKYKFLIQQLVARDFKVKYKRSILGYCWSFLNPLLTMMVQYVVFSTIFKTGIHNYPVYLLSGNIIFSFFTDAVGQGLMSIIGNASLITKVYVPKYIYPATKVLSCSINLFISVIPLLLVTLLTGGKINQSLFLLPYALLCLLIFCMGMVLFLSAANVFFRDVQYLWGIISLIWMYATPLFYPAEIIPENLRFIQTLNPMYHIITFVRSILIDGISPNPQVYFACIFGATVTFIVGAYVFKKTQGKFVLYI